MLSRSPSTTSTSPSVLSLRPKKLVGGSCLGSPTITTCLPRAMAPMASHTGICEASSNTTRSKLLASAERYCAIDSGLKARGQPQHDRWNLFQQLAQRLVLFFLGDFVAQDAPLAVALDAVGRRQVGT